MNTIDLRKYKIENSKAQKKSTRSPFDFLNKDFKFFRTKISDKNKEAFYHETSILLAAGVDLKTSLELYSQGNPDRKNKKIFEQISAWIIDGSSLSSAIQRSNQFTPYEFFSVQIGEESGKLDGALKLLGAYYKKKVKQRRQILHALTYPALVLTTSVLSVGFMIKFVIPMFASIFERFGEDLPYLTSLVLRISKIPLWHLFVMLLLIIGTYSWFLSKRTELVKKISTKIILRIPLVGNIVRNIYVSRFSQAMALLIGSQLPLLRAVTLVKQMMGFYPIEVALSKAEEDLIKGEHLHQSLAKFSIFPQKMISLIKIGEEINQLDVFFKRIADHYSDDVEHSTGVLSNIMEPFIIVFLGVIIGVILIAMYLPMFQLSSTL